MRQINAKTTLGEITRISTGKLDANAEKKDGIYPFFTCGDETLRIDKYAFDTEAVLLAGNGNFGTKYYSGKFNAYQRTYVIEPIQVNGKWLFYCVSHYISKITSASRGSTIQYLRIGDITDCPVILLPINEQKRIVAKIEELFSELDKGIESLKTAREQLKVYRHAVLKHAFEGKLTADWRKRNNVQETWASVPLKDVIEEPKYGTSKKCEYDTDGVGVLRIPNIVSGVVDSTDLKFANFDNDEIESYALQEGDILTIRSNGSLSIVGKCAIIRKQDVGFLYAGYLIKIRPIKQKICPEFLLHVLSSHDLRTQIESKAKSTSGVNNINSGEIKSLVIPVCCIEEQEEVVRRLSDIIQSIDRTEQDLDFQLNKVEALRQAILKKAFSGELVAQDPNDEPASILLERIRAEKESQSPQRKSKLKRGAA